MNGDDFVPFAEGGLWGFRDTTGKTVILPKFDSAGSFSEGLARVRSDGKWGFIDTAGAWVIRPRFDQAGVFTGGVAKVKEGEHWGLVDRTGTLVDKLDSQSYLDDRGRFISEREHKEWEKPPVRDREEEE
jgi:hypothetical protein